MKKFFTNFLFILALSFSLSISTYAQSDINKVYDSNGDMEVTKTDGDILLKYLFGFTGENLYKQTDIDPAHYQLVTSKIDYLKQIGGLDVDGDGEEKALTDGLLITRYIEGFRGDKLINGAISTHATRKTANQIISFLQNPFKASSPHEEEIETDFITQQGKLSYDQTTNGSRVTVQFPVKSYRRYVTTQTIPIGDAWEKETQGVLRIYEGGKHVADTFYTNIQNLKFSNKNVSVDASFEILMKYKSSTMEVNRQVYDFQKEKNYTFRFMVDEKGETEEINETNNLSAFTQKFPNYYTPFEAQENTFAENCDFSVGTPHIEQKKYNSSFTGSVDYIYFPVYKTSGCTRNDSAAKITINGKSEAVPTSLNSFTNGKRIIKRKIYVEGKTSTGEVLRNPYNLKKNKRYVASSVVDFTKGTSELNENNNSISTAFTLGTTQAPTENITSRLQTSLSNKNFNIVHPGDRFTIYGTFSGTDKHLDSMIKGIKTDQLSCPYSRKSYKNHPIWDCKVLKAGISNSEIFIYPQGFTNKKSNHLIIQVNQKQTTSYPTPTPYISSSPTPTPHQVEYEAEVITAHIIPFSDTKPTTLEGKAATYLKAKNIIGGFSDGTFRGNKNVNRAEAAKFLLLAKKIIVGNSKNNGVFADVVEGQWYVKYIIKARSLGILKGYADKTFRPGNTVNTAEFLKILTETFNLPKNQSYSYKDVKSSDWFSPYAGLAQKYNLFPYRSSKNLQPSRELTRKEVAIALYQYLTAQ